ncbi:hypothetical protein ACOMHN_024824 [Nucella lapillus]
MSNALKITSVKWMKLECVLPVFPLNRKLTHSLTLGKSLQSPETNLSQVGFNPKIMQPGIQCSNSNHCAKGACD